MQENRKAPGRWRKPDHLTSQLQELEKERLPRKLPEGETPGETRCRGRTPTARSNKLLLQKEAKLQIKAAQHGGGRICACKKQAMEKRFIWLKRGRTGNRAHRSAIGSFMKAIITLAPHGRERDGHLGELQSNARKSRTFVASPAIASRGGRVDARWKRCADSQREIKRNRAETKIENANRRLKIPADGGMARARETKQLLPRHEDFRRQDAQEITHILATQHP